MKLRIITLFTFMTMLALTPASHAQYQLLNPGFESWEGTSLNARPSNWSSFPQADGSWAWAASTAQHYHRNGGRPGTAGSSYVTIYSRSLLGVVANGNMTTGQIHAGSTSASSSSNYNYTHRGSDYCHAFSGTPDSMYVWVSFYAASAGSQGCVRAYLHGNTDFKDPNDCSTASLYCGKAVAQFTRTTSSSSTPTWVQQRVPFVYDGTSSVNFVLMSMTTNITAGGGSANDSLSVDDIQFVYSAWLDNIMVNGNGVIGFQRDIFQYADTLASLAELNAATVTFTKQASDAVVTVDTLRPDGLTRQFVLHVTAEDSVTSRTYTVTLTAPQPPCGMVDSIAVAVEGNRAVVSWVAGENNSSWELEYGPQGFVLGQGTDTLCLSSAALLSNLEYNSSFDLYIRAACGEASYTDWNGPIAFVTGEEPQFDCLPIDSVVVSDVDYTSCTIRIFSPYLGEEGDTTVEYQLLLVQGADTIADTVVGQTVVTFHALQEGTSYFVYVRTLCDLLHQSGWTVDVFTTPSDTTAITSAPDSNAGFRLYPNPAADRVRLVSVGHDGKEGYLTLYDNLGRKVMRQRVTINGGYLEVGQLPVGLYTAVLNVNGIDSALQRLSIVR